jgi:pimeloyl-ACP methyl ester carboxylesterase
MDGTGVLFKPLQAYFPAGLDYEVVCLNDLRGNSYSEQSQEIAVKIGSTPIIIVAESYSGRIAFELNRILKDQIQSVIFLASFITNPNPLTRLAAFVPEFMMHPKYLPKYVLNQLCFGGSSNDSMLAQIGKASELAGGSRLKLRIKNMASLTEPKAINDVRAIYVKPTREKLVGKQAVNVIQAVYSNLVVKEIEGGHFIAQTKPELVANIILNEANT